MSESSPATEASVVGCRAYRGPPGGLCLGLGASMMIRVVGRQLNRMWCVLGVPPFLGCGVGLETCLTLPGQVLCSLRPLPFHLAFSFSMFIMKRIQLSS